MKTRTYKVSDLRKFIKESANEFKPVMGKNVESDNKKINDKAYNDISKETKAYDGGARNADKKIKYPNTDNLGMQDLEYNNMNPRFKKDNLSRLKGYTSADAETKHKNDPKGNEDFNEIDGMDDNHKAYKKGKMTAKEIGLTSRMINKKDFENQTNSIFENKIVKIKFKNTEFITENHMLSKVPDDFKIEGKRFTMVDKVGNEYLVEWHNDDDDVKVLNETKVNKEKNRIHELFSYKSGESKTTNDMRLNEENKISDILNKTRKLIK